MDQQLSFEKHVLWKMKIPSENEATLSSPSFFIQGSEWCLQMHFERTMDEEDLLFDELTEKFSFYLCERKEGENASVLQNEIEPIPLVRSFDVSTYIRGQNQELQLHSFEKVEYSVHFIAGHELTDMIDYNPKIDKTRLVELVCIFHLPASDIACKTEPSMSWEKHVLWKMKIPSENEATLTSPFFFVQGSEWCLQLRVERTINVLADDEPSSNKYSIYLVKRNEGEVVSTAPNEIQPIALVRSFDVSTYIRGQNHKLEQRSIEKVEYSVCLIACFEFGDFIYCNPKIETTKMVEVVCIFHLPALDIVGKNEPGLSTSARSPIFGHSSGETYLDSRTHADLESLSLDLSNLLSNSSTSPSDVTVTCGDRTFPVHRTVLSARSDVFAAMFRTKMAESESGRVEIADMETSDFELFLGFLYSGKIHFPSEESALRLYAAADRYAVPSLVRAFFDYTVRNLNFENCLRFLEFTEMHGDENVKRIVLTYVAENIECLKREAWSSFCEKHPELRIKVYEARLASALSKQV